MVATVVLGLSFTRKQKTLAGYFLAERSAPWWAVGISVLACDLSAISYMGVPAWSYHHDLRYATTILMFPLIAIIVAYLFIPFLARLKVLPSTSTWSIALMESAVYLLRQCSFCNAHRTWPLPFTRFHSRCNKLRDGRLGFSCFGADGRWGWLRVDRFGRGGLGGLLHPGFLQLAENPVRALVHAVVA